MDTNPEIPADPPHILDDVEYILYQASSGKRLANYLIDTVIFYIFYRVVIIQLAVMLIRTSRLVLETKLALYSFSYLLVATGFILYFGALESFTGGKTIGKYITRTRAVDDDGAHVSPGLALLRALARLVPFEVFSGLGNLCYPWHDRWTKTVVIDERITTLPPQK